MKKIFTLVTCIFFAIAGSYADEQQSIKLNDDHTKDLVRLDYCNIFVNMVSVDNDNNAKITIEIENLDETNLLILFGHSYSEKELKKLKPTVAYDKKFPGTKGHRNIETYKNARNDFFIMPSEKCMLPEILVKDAEGKNIRLPFYIAKNKEKNLIDKIKGQNKLLLMEKDILELEIEADVKPDEDYLRLEGEYNSLLEEMSGKTFCNHPKHRPSLAKQEAPYKERIGKIRTEIDDNVSRHHWNTSDRGFQRYNALKQKLDSINFATYEGDCGRRHPGSKPSHKCKYCNLSLQQIYHKLDDYYKMIYNSSNRKATKESVMAEVNLLYKCCIDGKCVKHASSWKNSEYKDKISDRYNRISNF